ncbi:hypothetical protein D3C72_1597870 [compost metagenome]
METGELRIFRFFLVVIFAGVDTAVQIGEQLGDRLNSLVMLTGRRIEFTRFCHVAGLHGIGEQLGLFDQPFHFFGDVDFVFSNRPNQIHGVRFAVGGSTGRRGHGQLAFRIAEQPTGHVVFARFQIGGHLLGEARCDILALFHHHHPFQNFPLHVFLAGVVHHKLGFTGRHRQLHRLTLFVVNGNLYLRHVRRQGINAQRERRDSQ